MSNTDKTSIRISAGDDTRNFFRFMKEELESKDERDVITDTIWETENPDGLARDPVVTGATITLSVIGIRAIVRIVERYLMSKHAENVLELLIEAEPKVIDKLMGLAEQQSKLVLREGLTSVDPLEKTDPN